MSATSDLPGGPAAVPAGTATAESAADPPDRRPWGELAMAVLLGVLGIAVLIGTGKIVQPGSTNTVGPRFFPYVVGGLLVATAIALAVRVWRGDLAPAEGGEDIDTSRRMDLRAVAVIVVVFVAHALLINVVGWPLAVTVMFAGVAKALGAEGWIKPLAAGGITSVAVWMIFVLALGVSLPGGVLLEMVVGV